MKITNRFARLAAAAFMAGASFTAVPALLASPAFAAEPVATTGPVTDTTGSLSTSELTKAIEAYQDATGNVIRFVFVDDFDSYTSDTWAVQSAKKSGLSSNATLVAVATTSRQYSVASGKSAAITADDVKKALSESGAFTEFRSGHWTEGATAAVKYLTTTASSSSDSGSALLGGAILVGGGALGYMAYKRGKKKISGAQAETESIEALAKRASSQLISTDDAVRAASAELEFARAEFGLESTKEFADALAGAQKAVQNAFVIKQQLEDEIPETPAQQHAMNTQILELTEQAQSRLSSQAEGFQKLRNLVSRVDQYLGELETRASDIEAELPVLSAEIEQLALTNSPEAVATLRTYPSQITTFLGSARESIASGRASVAAGNRSEAVSYARLAEETIAHASGRATEIKGARAALADASRKVHEALRSISADVADAKRLGAGDTTIATRQAEAERLIATYSTSQIDPIKALADLAAAEDALDSALEVVRKNDDVLVKNRANAQRNRELALDTIARVDSEIDTYRFAINGDVRGQLAKARENVDRGDATTNPEAAAAYYKAAATAAQSAWTMLQQSPHLEQAGRARSGGGFDGMGGLLAGMVISSMLNGSHSHHSSGFGGFGNDDSGFGGFGGFDGGGFDGTFGGGEF